MPRALPTRCSASTRGLGTPLPARKSVDAFRTSPTVKRELRERVSRDGFEGAPAVLGRQRFGEVAEISLEDLVEPMLRELDPVIGDAALRVVVGTDLLGPLAGADLRAAGGRHLRLI